MPDMSQFEGLFGDKGAAGGGPTGAKKPKKYRRF
jgi:hypothetical protein